MEFASIAWLVLIAILIVIELATMGLTTIWFAGGAVAAFIVSILDGNIILQLILFFAVSIVLLVFTRPFAAKYINKNRVRTNVDSLIGKRAVVTQEINNLGATGEARIEGKEWMARTEEDEVIIPQGETVRILRVSGVKLIVKKEDEKER